MGEQINFHRCVLDECQEIKVATTKIAKMCQQVSVCVNVCVHDLCVWVCPCLLYTSDAADE